MSYTTKDVTHDATMEGKKYFYLVTEPDALLQKIPPKTNDALCREYKEALFPYTNRETMAVNFYLKLARSQCAVKAEITRILFHLMQHSRTISRDADT